MEIIRVSLRGALDTPAQDECILKELRRRRLLNRHHVFRGFRRRNLRRLLDSGIDHEPRRPTFVSTKEQILEQDDSRSENALRFAIDGGCLAVYAGKLQSDGALGCIVPPNIRDQLVAVLVLEF